MILFFFWKKDRKSNKRKKSQKNPTCRIRTSDLRIDLQPLQSSALPTELRSVCGRNCKVLYIYYIYFVLNEKYLIRSRKVPAPVSGTMDHDTMFRNVTQVIDALDVSGTCVAHDIFTSRKMERTDHKHTV